MDMAVVGRNLLHQNVRMFCRYSSCLWNPEICGFRNVNGNM